MNGIQSAHFELCKKQLKHVRQRLVINCFSDKNGKSRIDYASVLNYDGRLNCDVSFKGKRTRLANRYKNLLKIIWFVNVGNR